MVQLSLDPAYRARKDMAIIFNIYNVRGEGTPWQIVFRCRLALFVLHTPYAHSLKKD